VTPVFTHPTSYPLSGKTMKSDMMAEDFNVALCWLSSERKNYFC
jgi:hypothetical protein